LLLTGGVYLALAITLTIECVLAWLIRRPFIVHLVVVPWPLFLLPVLALLLLLGNL
jgi:hypothetical protein